MCNKQTAKKYNFQEFLGNHNAEIPIIQRDYAQGRKSKTKIRTKFLNKLFEHLENEKELELDFIYGTKKNNTIQILDGQQRLTTLFLLHWYIANQTGKVEELRNIFLENEKVKFTYQTRASSREFCQNLLDKGIDFDCLIETEEKKGISTTIIDSNWFYLFWKKDPTIKGMLNMLDTIHEKFLKLDKPNNEKLWENLKIIKFYHLPLKEFDLSDSLYIKMNSRGKKLNDFENFKAEFESFIKGENYEDSEKIEKEPKKMFAYKIDVDWSNLFWEFRNEKNTIDSQLMQFMAGVAINNYAENEEATDKETTQKRIQILANTPEELTPQDFPDENAFSYLKNCFNTYQQIQSFLIFKTNDLNKSLELWDYYDSLKTIFSEFINAEKPTYKQRLLFYGLTKYLIIKDKYFENIFEEESLKKWLRVVRNIVENTEINNSNFISAIKLINELSKGCNSIYKYLNENEVKTDFAKNQIAEEKVKAKLILENQDWKEAIFKIEDDSFLKGQILFLIKFANSNYESFIKYSKVYKKFFQTRDDLLRRGLLCNGDYSYWEGFSTSLNSHRYHLLNTDKHWKQLFVDIAYDENKVEIDFYGIKKKEILLSFFEDAEKNATLERNNFLNKKIERFKNSGLNDDDKWKQKIIIDSTLLKKCKHKKFCWNNNSNKIFILEKTKIYKENYKEILY